MAEVISGLRPAAESVELTPDVVAFTEMITENVENPDPQEVEDARRRYVAIRDQRAAKPTEQTDREILQSIADKVANLEAERATPQQGWSNADEQHIINSINYASAGAGLNINFRDNDQMNAVMHGVQPGESLDSVIETRDDFLEAVADGRLKISEYPRYASLFS